MAKIYLYEPTDTTVVQSSAAEIERNQGPINLYSSDSSEIWVGTGDFGEEADYLYEGYGLLQGTTRGALTGVSGWLDQKLHFIIDEFDVSVADFTNFTPGKPISQLGIFMGADDMVGSYGNDVVKTMGGPDYLDGQGGNDILYGGAGGDDMYGGQGNDQLIGGNGSDYMEGEVGNDIIKAGAGADTLFGGSGSDVLIGGGGANYIYGGSDNNVDTITVLTDGNFLGRKDHAKFDDLYELGANDKIIMDVRGSATLEFTSFDAGEIDIWVDGELEAVVHGLSLSQVKAMTSLG